MPLGGFQPPTGLDNRAGYNPRGAYPPGRGRGGGGRGGDGGGGGGGGMYPIQPLPALVNTPYGGGPSLGTRYPSAPILTSTRVSDRVSLTFACSFPCIGHVTE